jgi:regulator of sirC expression with transglutaminase-like and TPR domain
MIKELKKLQNILHDMAAELYGDLWIMNDKFWNSPTERQLREVTMQLIDLGVTIDPSDEQQEAAKIVAKKFGFELPPED